MSSFIFYGEFVLYFDTFDIVPNFRDKLMKTLVNKAKAISAELLKLNLKNKMEEMGKTRCNRKKWEEEKKTGRKKHRKPKETG